MDIVRQVIAREAPVTLDGQFFQLPLRGGTGLGKPLKSTVHPLRKEIPIHLAAEGPKNIALAAKIRDELSAWEDTVVTSLLLRGDADALTKIADALY